MLNELLGSKLRAKVLGWLLTHAGQRYFVRQLTVILGEDPTNVSRELARLSRLGILTVKVEGRQVYYQANHDCPVFEELRGLMVKTAGLGDALRQALEPLKGGVRVAFIYGSFAKAKENAGSDVDVMAVGNAGLKQLAAALQPASRRVGREINVVAYPEQEFRAKAGAGHHFVTEVLKEKKIFLIGGPGDIKELLG